MTGIDPICGMKGTIPSHGMFFCSDKCVKAYEKRLCCECESSWYKDKLFIIISAFLVIYISSFFFSPFRPLYDSLNEYLSLIWWAIILGLILGGMIDHFVPSDYVQSILGSMKKRSIVYAVSFGFLMSACSHGILAIAIQLYKKGASTASVVAFLLASPWANLPVTILLFGFFGWKAFLFIFCAIAIALITGLIFLVLEKRGMVESNAKSTKGFSIMKDMKRRFSSYSYQKGDAYKAAVGVYKGSVALSRMVLWWMLIGILFAAAMNAFIPEHLFMMYLGPTLLGMALVLLVAIVLEVCSEGTAPVAFEIYSKTGAFGNSFIFLMAGVATDYTEIGLIWANIGRKAALWLPVITVPQIVFLGWLFNHFI